MNAVLESFRAPSFVEVNFDFRVLGDFPAQWDPKLGIHVT